MLDIINNSSQLTAIMTFAGICIIAIYTVYNSTNKNKADKDTNYTTKIIDDGRQLRTDLITVMNALREENKELQNKVDSLNTIIGDLRGQNYSLAGKIDDLTTALSKFQCGTSTTISTTSIKKDV